VSIALISHYLYDNWEASISGREVDVPYSRVSSTGKPYITTEKGDTQGNVEDNDIIVVKDGGVEERNPASLHYDYESSDRFVQLDIRTADFKRLGDFDGDTIPWSTKQTPGEIALNGLTRDVPPYDSERHGGLIGEVTRVTQEIRRGQNEIDIIEITQVNDLSGQEDKGRYRANVTIRLRTIADEVDTSL